MNILHIITGLGDGGAEATLYRLCSADTKHRHRVISLMEGGKYRRLLEDAGIHVATAGMPRGRLSPAGLRRIFAAVRDAQPDVVQTWMYHADLIGGTIARMAGVRRVFWGIRNSDLELGASRTTTAIIARTSARLSRWIPSGIVCCADRARHIHERLGYVSRKMVVIPNGYDVAVYRPNDSVRANLRHSWNVDDETPVIGCVARFDAQKDHGNLLRALAALKSTGIAFRCVLVGRGMDSENQWLTERIDRYDLRSEILLLGPRADVPALMVGFDLHVLPSAYGEAFPNVVAEAMACGTPCIATDVGDAVRIIGDVGWVVPPRDAAGLAAAINAAVDAWRDPVSWDRIRAAARSRIATHFTIDRMVASYHDVWESK